jgi:hypothetical protein
MADTAKIKKTLVAALKDYFGFKDGEGLQDFRRELMKLTPEDKAWFGEQLETVGYEIIKKT